MGHTAIAAARNALRKTIVDVAARIRVLRLDASLKDDPSSAAQTEAAEQLLTEYPEALVDRALSFAEYVAQLVKPDCDKCEGVGARALPPQCECGAVLVLEKGVDLRQQTTCADCRAAGKFDNALPRPRYVLCECVIAADREMRERAADTDANRGFVTQTTKPTDLDARIAQQERVRAQTVEAIRSACADTDAKIAAHAQEMAGFVDTEALRHEEAKEAHEVVVSARRTAEECARRWTGMIEEKERELAALCATAKDVIAQADAHVAVAEAAAEIASERAQQATHALAPLRDVAARLHRRREQIAGRYTRRLQRAEKTLRRLLYLRGDAPVPADASDANVADDVEERADG